MEKRCVTPPNFISEQQTVFHIWKLRYSAKIWCPIKVSEVEIAALGGHWRGQGPGEKKVRSKILKSAIFELHKRYTPQKEVENNHFSEFKSNIWLFCIEKWGNKFEICKKKCYHLKEGLKKYPDQWVDFLGLKPTSFVKINGVLLKWQFSEFDLLQPLRKWNSHHFSLLKNKLIFIVSCFSQCVNRQSKNKKLTYVQNSNFA